MKDEWKQLDEQCSYLDWPAKVALVRLDEENVLLIDAGSDRDAGRRIRKSLDAKGWKIAAIVITHSNADHIGGCSYLQKQYGCKIYCSRIEDVFTSNPILEPSFLYGGCPDRSLRGKFLMAMPSSVSSIEEFPCCDQLRIFDLPGHFLNMVGFESRHGTVFLADSLSSRQTLEKYGIPFLYDIEAQLCTLDQIENMKGNLFVPSHAPVCTKEELKTLVDLNRQKVYEIERTILNMLESAKSFEDLLAGLFEHYGLKMDSVQYVLVGSTIRSFLSWMLDRGCIEQTFEHNRKLYRKTD